MSSNLSESQIQNDLAILIDAAYGYSRPSLAGMLKELFIGSHEGWDAVMNILRNRLFYQNLEQIREALWNRLTELNFEWISRSNATQHPDGAKSIVSRMAFVLRLYLDRLEKQANSLCPP